MCYLNLKSKSFLFADDTTISFSSESIEELIQTLSADLKIISEWLKHNRLLLNVKKTNAIFFSNGCRLNSKLVMPTLLLDNVAIPFVLKTRLLGVIIDDKLNFKDHISTICRNVSIKLRTLGRCAFLFNEGFRTILFKLFFLPSYDYCSTLFFHNTNKNDSDRLDKSFSKTINNFLRIQLYSIIKTGNKTNYYALDHIDQNKKLGSIQILPLKLRYFYHYIKFIHSSLLKTPNTSLVKFIRSHEKTEGSTRVNKYIKPQFKTKIMEFSFSTISVNLLNIFLNNYLSLNDNQFKTTFNNFNYLFIYYTKYTKSLRVG